MDLSSKLRLSQIPQTAVKQIQLVEVNFVEVLMWIGKEASRYLYAHLGAYQMSLRCGNFHILKSVVVSSALISCKYLYQHDA